MTWIDRLKPEIVFTSPTGQEFSAHWSGGPRTVEKKLGIFSYPKVAGAIVQDLGVNADMYPLTFYFEGVDHDLEARRFFTACKESGTWQVNHPVHGLLTLQLMTVTEEIQPVTSGNITTITSEWVEPFTDTVVASVVELEKEIETKAAELRTDISQQLDDIVELDEPSKLTSFKNAVNQAVTDVTDILGSASQQVGEVNGAFLSVKRGITGALDTVALDVIGLGGQVQTLVNLPGDSLTDIKVRIDYYTNLILKIAESLSPLTAQSDGVNTVAVQETVLIAAISSVVTGASTGELNNREDAITILDDVAALFLTVTETLDASQTLYSDNTVDNQYFSQSSTFNSVAQLIGQLTALLLRKSFDLAVAKRFTLTRSRTPVEIAATEYGDLDHFDFFIASNNLKANDILLLPPGREVVVYL